MAANAASAFESGGRAIRIERFDAPVPAERPGILLLHGADGLTYPERYRFAARTVAGAGYHVFLPHYLDRTGERRASFGTIERHFPDWLGTIRDAVTYVGAQPGVDPHRIAVIGASLGGALALAAAADDPRIGAVVDYFGFLPPDVASRATRLPPTLILHGAKDPIVPASNAHRIAALLARLRVPHECKIYPGQGHGFAGEAAFDSAARAAAFLARHLHGHEGAPGLNQGLGGMARPGPL